MKRGKWMDRNNGGYDGETAKQLIKRAVNMLIKKSKHKRNKH